jgi:glyoxylase I family protein
MIKGMEHVGLCAEEPKTLVEWYVRILGFRIVRARGETYFIRAHDGGMLEIYPAQHSADPVDNVHRGLRHVALLVSDFDLEIGRLRSTGVTVPDDSIVMTADMKLAFFRDPEGNLLHLVERRKAIPGIPSRWR